MQRSDRTRNARMGLIFGSLALGMVGMAFAAVPAYRLFCQITGYGGTPRIAEAGVSGTGVLDQTITVAFDASVNGALPWRFVPVQRAVEVRIGEENIAFYEATNTSDQPITGMATFNVTPLKAGRYFVKIDCFCFIEQTLQPGETVSMPVLFQVDPAIATDRNTTDVSTITLSYTFFHKGGGEQAQSPDTPRVAHLGDPR